MAPDPSARRPQPRRRPAARRPSQRTVLIIFAAACLLALMVFAVRSGARTATSADHADPTDAQQVARGQLVYATRCASCHGAALQGEPGWPQPRANGTLPAPPLGERGSTWRQTDQWIYTTIKQGGQANAAPGQASSMPAFAGGLTDADIWATIAFIKSSWPSQLRDAQP